MAEQQEQKTPKWYDDVFNPAEPPDNIPCKTCILREDDRSLGDSGKIIGYKLGICKAFPKLKPDDVLWHGKHCPYRIKDE